MCMKIGLSEVVLCVIFFCALLFPLRGGRTWTLGSEYELTKLILQVGCLRYNLTS